MRQLIFHEPGKVGWEEIAEPIIQGPREALVRPTAVAACDLDAALMRGLFPVPGPFPLGHEFVGEVVSTGDEVGTVTQGQQVVASFQISCGECDRCSRGVTGSCRRANPGAMYGLGDIGGREWGGAFTDLVRVPFANTMLTPIPDGLEPHKLATASDNIVDGYRTVAPGLSAVPGADVLVVGGGAPSISLFAVASAKALGANKVDYIDQSKTRLGIAEKLGANAIEGPPPEKTKDRYQVTVDASGNPDGLLCVINSTEPYGHCTSVGIYPFDLPLPLFQMYSKGIHFTTGRPNAVADLPAVIDLVASGKIDPDIMTTFADWDDAAEALASKFVKLVVKR